MGEILAPTDIDQPRAPVVYATCDCAGLPVTTLASARLVTEHARQRVIVISGAHLGGRHIAKQAHAYRLTRSSRTLLSISSRTRSLRSLVVSAASGNSGQALAHKRQRMLRPSSRTSSCPVVALRT